MSSNEETRKRSPIEEAGERGARRNGGPQSDSYGPPCVFGRHEADVDHRIDAEETKLSFR